MRAAILVLITAVTLRAEDAPAVMYWRTGVIGQQEPRRLPLQAEPPKGVILPDENQEGILYAQVRLGDKATLTILAAVDALWIDRDMDGDLKEEKATNWYGTPDRRYRNVHIEVPFLGMSEPVPIQVMIAYRPQVKPARIYVTARAHRRGAVVLAGRQRDVILADADGDMRFDQPDKDRLFLDLNGDGKINTGNESLEEIRAGLPFRLKGRGFVATVPDTGGGRVLFAEVGEPPPPGKRRWIPRVAPRAGVRARGGGDIATIAAAYLKATENKTQPYGRFGPVHAMGRVGTLEAFQQLWRVYRRDEFLDVRTLAVEQMGYLQYVDQAKSVAKIAQSRKPKLRMAAIKALHNMAAPDREQTYVKLLYKVKDEQVFAALAKYLAFTGSETARVKLVEAAARHSRGACRYLAYFYGTRYFEKPATPELMRASIRCNDQRLVAVALTDLRYFGLPEARALALQASKAKIHERSNSLALAITEILATEGDGDAIRALLPLAERESPSLRARIQDLLVPVRDPGGIAAITKGVAWRMERVRVLCARVLAFVATPETTRALAEQLGRERDEEVAMALVKALASHGGAEGAAAIVNASRRHERNDTLRRVILRSLADIGMEYGPVREYFQQKLESNKWEERVLAIGAATRARVVGLVPGLIANLDHREWRVRLAAIQAFRNIRVKEAIQPLIGRLHEEEKTRLRGAIGETLQLLTGQTIFADYELWARWWRDARDGFKVPDKVKRVRKPGTKTVARFYGLPVDSERIVFVIDQSGSMSSATGKKSDYKIACDEVLSVMRRLKRGAKANVILFETDIHPWKKILVSVNDSSRAKLQRYLESNGPTGGTNLFDGLEMGLLHKGVDTIFLLSDGMPHSGKFSSESDIIREVRRINELKRITIHCVSLGRDSSLLKRLASENGGRYVRR